MLDPRAIATQGIGYGANLVAHIGLWPVAPPDSGWHGGGYLRAGVVQRDLRRRRNDDDDAFLLAVLL